MKILNGVRFGDLSIIVVFMVLTIFPAQSFASTLVGDTVNASLFFPSNQANSGILDVNTAIVGSDTEFTILSGSGGDLFHIDIGNDFILIAIAPSSTMKSGFSKQLILEGIDWFGEPSLNIGSISLETGTDKSYFPEPPTGITLADISFSDHSLTFEYGNDAYWTRKSWAKITLTPSSGEIDPPATIPEPATMLLFGFGLIGLAGVGRRKKGRNE